jgi:hypothetical protein
MVFLVPSISDAGVEAGASSAGAVAKGTCGGVDGVVALEKLPCPVLDIIVATLGRSLGAWRG